MADGQRDLSPTVYVIRIKGHLDVKWAEWFYDLALTHESDGTTTLSGPLPDQTALHSVLARIRDMNLALLSVCSADDSTHKADVEDDLATGASGGACTD